jgi:hypothetical protein
LPFVETDLKALPQQMEWMISGTTIKTKFSAVYAITLFEIPALQQSGEDSFCLEFSCFVLCFKTKNEVGFGAKPQL